MYRAPQLLLTLTLSLTVLAAPAAPLRIASLNPIVSDLARQVGGDRVEVIDLMPPGANPHNFSPSPAELKEASQAALVLAAGKGLEPYLPEFAQSLGGNIPIFEVGNAVPSIRITDPTVFICCPSHPAESIDPHWWHSVRNARRACRAIADQLTRVDPAGRDQFEAGYSTISKQLRALEEWVRKEISSIPRRDRELTTSHASFGYFCRDFGLRSITVQGFTTEQNPEPSHLKKVVRSLRDAGVRAVFPEDNANPKVLASMVRETGVAVGGPLLAGSLPADDPTYEAMIRHNVRTIVEALAPGVEE